LSGHHLTEAALGAHANFGRVDLEPSIFGHARVGGHCRRSVAYFFHFVHRLGLDQSPTKRIVPQQRNRLGDRAEWERVAGIASLGLDLPDSRPGCGAKNIEPGVFERLKIRFNETGLKSRRIAIGEDEDEQEAMCERGWSDGLPLVPPTEERVLRMLDGTSRDPQEVIGLIPPALQPATVEKIAVNAVMAGASRNTCRSCSPRSTPCSKRALRCMACWRRRCSSVRWWS
jgi:hypothetical protein